MSSRTTGRPRRVPNRVRPVYARCRSLDEGADEEALRVRAAGAALRDVRGEPAQAEPAVAPGAAVGAVPGFRTALGAAEHLLQEGLRRRLREEPGQRRGAVRGRRGELREDLADPGGGGAARLVDGRQDRSEPLEVAAGALVVVLRPADAGGGGETQREAREPHGLRRQHARRQLHGQFGEGASDRAPAGAVFGGLLHVGAVEEGEGGAAAVGVADLLEQRGLAHAAAAGEDGDGRVVAVLAADGGEVVRGEAGQPRGETGRGQDRLATV
ncbi:hypothetical protein [Streptomyces sudanensis]|uniref:hypothetical protein n=1 Tax=Streptomyces sudanensis TaxID=436397 RepID=UPI0020CE0A65|nr:hypothetical protein [Streptomyces sudanensis]MCP9957840.1 hypothetical protein [Streptomyces sudanensis]